jgi:hypothetical protein
MIKSASARPIASAFVYPNVRSAAALNSSTTPSAFVGQRSRAVRHPQQNRVALTVDAVEPFGRRNKP